MQFTFLLSTFLSIIAQEILIEKAISSNLSVTKDVKSDLSSPALNDITRDIIEVVIKEYTPDKNDTNSRVDTNQQVSNSIKEEDLNDHNEQAIDFSKAHILIQESTPQPTNQNEQNKIPSQIHEQNYKLSQPSAENYYKLSKTKFDNQNEQTDNYMQTKYKYIFQIKAIITK